MPAGIIIDLLVWRRYSSQWLPVYLVLPSRLQLTAKSTDWAEPADESALLCFDLGLLPWHQRKMHHTHSHDLTV